MKKDKRRLDLTHPAIYQIVVAGHLDTQKAAWFEDLTLSTDHDDSGNPVTLLRGKIVDQSMLHSLLTRIRDLGLPLISVECIDVENDRQ
jgi:hypothetical protein